MARGNISHIALTVSDLDRSTAFYDKVLEIIGGFKRVEVPESTQQAMKTRLKAWVGPGYSISIRPSKGEVARRLHDRNPPGFNHECPPCFDRRRPHGHRTSHRNCLRARPRAHCHLRAARRSRPKISR